MAVSSLFGAKVKRVEDPKLITGQGIYVDDITLPDMLYMTVLRSPYAHAKINSIDSINKCFNFINFCFFTQTKCITIIYI